MQFDKLGGKFVGIPTTGTAGAVTITLTAVDVLGSTITDDVIITIVANTAPDLTAFVDALGVGKPSGATSTLEMNDKCTDGEAGNNGHLLAIECRTVNAPGTPLISGSASALFSTGTTLTFPASKTDYFIVCTCKDSANLETGAMIKVTIAN